MQLEAVSLKLQLRGPQGLKPSIQHNRHAARLEVAPFLDTTLAKQVQKRCPGEECP
jgi:hypothetical protein